jgi:hypothetical protein
LRRKPSTAEYEDENDDEDEDERHPTGVVTQAGKHSPAWSKSRKSECRACRDQDRTRGNRVRRRMLRMPGIVREQIVITLASSIRLCDYPGK